MYIVTGVSGGIGRAVVLACLARGEKVIGIGRKNDICHPDYTFIQCDLSDSKAIDKLKLKLSDDVVLINNAGVLGQIGRISQKSESEIDYVFSVNTVGPLELTRKIYNSIKDKNRFVLVNISSGAANRAILSWGPYCASKAALNMLSEVFFMEERELGFFPKVYCVAPGVVDTAMQQQIRSADPEDFSEHEKFVMLKETGKLFSPELVAEKLLQLLDQPYSGEIRYDLRKDA